MNLKKIYKYNSIAYADKISLNIDVTAPDIQKCKANLYILGFVSMNKYDNIPREVDTETHRPTEPEATSRRARQNSESFLYTVAALPCDK